ncbi:hypothetical protein [Erythrobacter crassostreae]|uniref:Uncharacterized protein n=1 Tax=Erythrobacter crassostreae TaxID=2828328 RepID=A0A9X1F428_9SPHN|nr:hypothetical protein [Erythrobacter crassostrea]MBV7259108.1 hypothetical protein [Erythrobacter crassostrea]
MRALPWLLVALTGVAAPVVAMLLLFDASDPASIPPLNGPILAVGLMGVSMIGAAATGRLWVGVLLGLLSVGGLILLAYTLGMPTVLHPLSVGFAVIIASISFAVRGALFARSASDRGWWVALFVVGGEAAVVATAAARPDMLPDWLLALLPAQWASMAIQAALTNSADSVANSALIALAGTAAATLVVVWLWPRRWPYLLMFSAWLGFSALVYHSPAPELPRVDQVSAAAPVSPLASGTARYLHNFR